jgi:hypothetical protein
MSLDAIKQSYPQYYKRHIIQEIIPMKKLLISACTASLVMAIASANAGDATDRVMTDQAAAINGIGLDLMNKVEQNAPFTTKSDNTTPIDLSGDVQLNESLVNALVSAYAVSEHGVITLTLNKTAIMAPLAGDVVTLTPQVAAEDGDTDFQHKSDAGIDAWRCTVVRPSGQANPADFSLGGASGRNVWLAAEGPMKTYCSKVANNTEG